MWHSWTCLRCASSAAVKQRASSCFIARRTSGSGWTESGAERSEDHARVSGNGVSRNATRGSACPTRDARARSAADLLVATYGDRAYRLAIGITRNEQDAEEAVQDSFWSVVRKIDTFRGDS